MSARASQDVPRDLGAAGDTGRDSGLKSPWAIALLAVLVLRLAILGVAYAFPEGGAIVDSRAYLDMADALRHSGWEAAQESSLHWTPGYPLFLVLAEWMTGSTFVGVGFLQLMLTGAACLLLWWMGRLLDTPRAGLAAGLLYALSPNTTMWSLTIMSETLFAFLLVVSSAAWLAVMARRRPIWGVLAGATLAAAGIVRPVGLPLILVWLGAGLVVFLKGEDRRAWWRNSALLLAGFACGLAPLLVRNWQTTGRWVVADVAGDTFVQFNLAYVVAEAEGISRDEAAARLGASVHSWSDRLAVVRQYPSIFLTQQLKGIRRSVIGVESGVWARQLGYDLGRQGSFDVLSLLLAGKPELALARLSALLADRETVLHVSLTLAALLYTIVVYVLALYGSVWGIGRPGLMRAAVVLFAATAIFLLAAPGAAGQARFRIPAEPFLAMLAGIGWARSVDVARRRRGERRRGACSRPRQPDPLTPAGGAIRLWGALSPCRRLRAPSGRASAATMEGTVMYNAPLRRAIDAIRVS